MATKRKALRPNEETITALGVVVCVVVLYVVLRGLLMAGGLAK